MNNIVDDLLDNVYHAFCAGGGVPQVAVVGNRNVNDRTNQHYDVDINVRVSGRSLVSGNGHAKTYSGAVDDAYRTLRGKLQRELDANPDSKAEEKYLKNVLDAFNAFDAKLVRS